MSSTDKSKLIHTDEKDSGLVKPSVSKEEKEKMLSEMIKLIKENKKIIEELRNSSLQSNADFCK